LSLSIRPLKENDLPEADRIIRLAFGTFLGLPDPMTFFGDADYVRTRFHADPSAAYGAIIVDDDDHGNGNGKLIGSNFIANWGSVGFFGPLTIHPDYWGKGIARSLMEPTIQLFSTWNTKHAGLFTFAHSTKHISLYQKFGFWPYFLTAIMSKKVSPIENKNGKNSNSNLKWSKYSVVSKRLRVEGEKEKRKEEYLLNACKNLTNAIYDGLDLSIEILSVMKQGLGDIVLVWDVDNKYRSNNNRLAAFGICHCGKGTEAGTDTCYVKFAAVQPPRTAKDGHITENDFENLLNALEAFALEQGLQRLVAGVNTCRQRAYMKMLSHGFHTDMLGVAMQKGNDMGYNRPDVFIIDDWR
jgi:GNAT superfamily N-acetyltransferase